MLIIAFKLSYLRLNGFVRLRESNTNLPKHPGSGINLNSETGSVRSTACFCHLVHLSPKKVPQPSCSILP